MQMLTKDL